MIVFREHHAPCFRKIQYILFGRTKSLEDQVSGGPRNWKTKYLKHYFENREVNNANFVFTSKNLFTKHVND